MEIKGPTLKKLLEIHCERGSRRERTKVPFHSSKYCPECLRKGERVKRGREHHLFGPLDLERCNQQLPVLLPKRSAKKVWWNRGFVRWLIAPPEPPDPHAWFETSDYATCPIHGTEKIIELAGRRQFGRLRLLIFWFRDIFDLNFIWIRPKQ